jgi:hypothetical protein
MRFLITPAPNVRAEIDLPDADDLGPEEMRAIAALGEVALREHEQLQDDYDPDDWS